jgi:hypothetical protein
MPLYPRHSVSTQLHAASACMCALRTHSKYHAHGKNHLQLLVIDPLMRTPCCTTVKISLPMMNCIQAALIPCQHTRREHLTLHTSEPHRCALLCMYTCLRIASSSGRAPTILTSGRMPVLCKGVAREPERTTVSASSLRVVKHIELSMRFTRKLFVCDCLSKAAPLHHVSWQQAVLRQCYLLIQCLSTQA